ncbi:hypothetical protein Q3G72_032872 [Acer saccharum]|nr:hypothetical protein Q3G72_032872 [Acer saccharum]
MVMGSLNLKRRRYRICVRLSQRVMGCILAYTKTQKHLNDISTVYTPHCFSLQHSQPFTHSRCGVLLQRPYLEPLD